mmetsp:Transcript_4199/g.12133  ORF Transcript_4199/g.12133 Transcript_4199/m.12133 type:complete len:240 (-) Transcript_4199:338-1057(-)
MMRLSQLHPGAEPPLTVQGYAYAKQNKNNTPLSLHGHGLSTGSVLGFEGRRQAVHRRQGLQQPPSPPINDVANGNALRVHGLLLRSDCLRVCDGGCTLRVLHDGSPQSLILFVVPFLSAGSHQRFPLRRNIFMSLCNLSIEVGTTGGVAFLLAGVCSNGDLLAVGGGSYGSQVPQRCRPKLRRPHCLPRLQCIAELQPLLCKLLRRRDPPADCHLRQKSLPDDRLLLRCRCHGGHYAGL